MNTITICLDEDSEMACVDLNNKCIMMGNFWDFHPNCHGIHEYGDFSSYTQLAMAVQSKVGGQIVYDYTWRYE